MEVSIVLYAIGIIISGIMALISATFCIIALVGNKNQKAGIWGGGFIVSLIVLIACILVVVKRVSSKVRDGIAWAQENSNMDSQIGDYNDTKNQTRQYFLDSLQKYTPEKFAQTVPLNFYQNKQADTASDGRLIFPFLFPYQLVYNSEHFIGDIVSATSDSVLVRNVSTMAFDNNFVICKVDNTSNSELLKAGRGEIEYLLFDLRTGEYLDFVNREILIEKAGKIGYTGPQEMTYLSDIYTGWIEYPQSD